jgi:transposase-like protein/IS1 family transposase
MILATCSHESTKKHGKDRKGHQRFRCRLCGETWIEPVAKPLRDMRISMCDATLALGMLLEGMSVRAVERLSGLHRDTICELILTVGENCGRLLQSKLKAVPVKDVQLDEIWSFIGIAIGQRDTATSMRFLKQLNAATSGRFQLSTDGLGSYTLNVPFVFGSRVDFAQLIKNFQSTQSTVRYSPAKITNTEKLPRFGNPDFDKICTSHVERLNLTLRMNMRRFTRLTNGHSKSPKHHAAMQAIFFAWYNFCRKHQD